MNPSNIPDSTTIIGKPHNSSQETSGLSSLCVIVFLSLHVPLAIAMKASPSLATIHAVGALLIGFFFLAQGQDPNRVIYVAAYIVGAEPLWRLGHAAVFWEYAKYGVSLLLILGMLKQNGFSKSNKKPLLYFLFLLPSLLVLPVFDRRDISFNLSGPFALAVATIFFSTVKLRRPQVATLLLAMLAPIIGAAFLATSGTLAYDQITLSGSSKITSAGYGPNQMSSMFGLGGMIAFLYATIYREQGLLTKLMLGVFIWLAVQGALTFSRGGLWTMFGGMMVASFYLIRDRRFRRSILLGGCFVFLLSVYIILPMLNTFTKGTLLKRFEDFDTTGRDRIVQADLMIFRENPLLGVGLGQSNEGHALTYRVSGAHTEYSRLLAEHGSFGLMALFILITIAFQRFKSTQSPKEKALILSFTAWAMLFMLHAAIRLAAPAFLFGLGSATFLLENNMKPPQR